MFKWVITMPEDEYDNNFISIDDFVDCINRGAEVEFLYENKNYSITHAGKKIAVAEYYNGESEKRYKNPIDALQYPIGEKCLGGILGDIKIIFRSL
ncbi:MAG: hypothetical protein FWG90_11380 [Oscillospiraceae bacterium]|nr:hypothetical protein [Oscillospiraceae bacterium]